LIHRGSPLRRDMVGAAACPILRAHAYADSVMMRARVHALSSATLHAITGSRALNTYTHITHTYPRTHAHACARKSCRKIRLQKRGHRVPILHSRFCLLAAGTSLSLSLCALRSLRLVPALSVSHLWRRGHTVFVICRCQRAHRWRQLNGFARRSCLSRVSRITTSSQARTHTLSVCTTRTPVVHTSRTSAGIMCMRVRALARSCHAVMQPRTTCSMVCAHTVNTCSVGPGSGSRNCIHTYMHACSDTHTYTCMRGYVCTCMQAHMQHARVQVSEFDRRSSEC
jgi:hypothetical protein